MVTKLYFCPTDWCSGAKRGWTSVCGKSKVWYREHGNGKGVILWII